MNTRIVALALAGALAAIPAAQVCAQAWPSKPVRIVLPFPAGGSADVFARLVGAKLQERLGQSVIVDNRVGAGGTIGASVVAKAPADGHTLLMTTASTQVTPLYLSSNLPYDPVKDFTAITAAVESYQGLVVDAAQPFKSLQEMLEYARRNPGKLSYSSAGQGTEFHMVGELFRQAAGVDILHVPYKGAAQALTDVVAGRITMTFGTLQAERAFMRSGKARLIAVLNAQRFPGEPNVPTIKEIVPSFERPFSWQGIFGPAALPAAIVQKISSEVKALLDAPDVRPKLEEAAQRSIAAGPEAFEALLRKNREDYARAVKAAGLKPE